MTTIPRPSDPEGLPLKSHHGDEQGLPPVGRTVESVIRTTGNPKTKTGGRTQSPAARHPIPKK
jgi:hypothetical protein